MIYAKQVWDAILELVFFIYKVGEPLCRMT